MVDSDAQTPLFLNSINISLPCHSDTKVELQDILWLQSDHPSASEVKRWRTSWRVSLQDILAVVDLKAEFAWRRQVYFTIGVSQMSRALLFPAQVTSSGSANGGAETEKPSQCFLPFFRDCANEKRLDVFEALDRVAATTTSPGVAARTLACIADMLGVLANNKGGLRSGPGRNASFMPAFNVCFSCVPIHLHLLHLLAHLHLHSY